MAPFVLLAVFGAALSPVAAQFPPWQQSWRMSDSSIAMPCNFSGYTEPSSVAGWSITSFDWSNSLYAWSAATPMDTDERNLAQVALSKAANPAQKVWIYRNSVYGYPWYYEVRALLDDPEYRPWFIMFNNQSGPSFSPMCDVNYSPPLCTDYFHTQMDTPQIPGKSGYGTCAPPACNCGTKPCGFYVFNHSSDVVIRGQSFQQWFINSYMLSAVGSSPLVSGFFWDDFWHVDGDMGDNTPHAITDMGLTPADLQQLTASYDANMAALRASILAAGKFSWQMLWTGGAADAVGSTCPQPLVQKATCAADLRALCSASSPAQTNRTLMYAFSPGGCSHVNPDALPDLVNDLANFLLVRGPFAYLGTAWVGCSRKYFFPPQLAVDYGVPAGLCAETAPGSGVFSRDFSASIVSMDCNMWNATITMK